MRAEPSDANLLERFVSRRDEGAFALLVQRHGPRVLQACRRILRNEHDAEEVSQAVFLVLARRAGEIDWRESVGGWLCGVAQRLSLNARSGATRRLRHERPVTALARGAGRPEFGYDVASEEEDPTTNPFAEIARRELKWVLGEELSCLPEKYRAPMVLCYLEGMTNEEAARELGWPSGSMSRRLERGRSILRQRLAHRGMLLGLLLVSSLLAFLPLSRTSGPNRATFQMMRATVSPFEPHRQVGEDLDLLLARILRSNSAQATLNTGLEAAEAAQMAVEQFDRTDLEQTDEPTWRKATDELRRSAKSLDDAVRDKNSDAVRDAARILKRQCIQCHVAWR